MQLKLSDKYIEWHPDMYIYIIVIGDVVEKEIQYNLSIIKHYFIKLSQ